jgi:hypothetical protein
MSTQQFGILNMNVKRIRQATRANDDVGNGSGIEDAGWRHYQCCSTSMSAIHCKSVTGTKGFVPAME